MKQSENQYEKIPLQIQPSASYPLMNGKVSTTKGSLEDVQMNGHINSSANIRNRNKKPQNDKANSRSAKNGAKRKTSLEVSTESPDAIISEADAQSSDNISFSNSSDNISLSNSSTRLQSRPVQSNKPKIPGEVTFLDGTPLEKHEVDILKSIVGKWKELCNKRKDNGDKASQYRKGPAPVDEGKKGKKRFVIRCSHGTLDSDCDSIPSDDENAKTLRETYASSKGLILYFSKLAVTPDESEGVDLKFVTSLLNGGADINFCDKYGQTILHEVARSWHTDVAKFLIGSGAAVNQSDKYGRTALHLCAAVGYIEMIEFLIQNGANLHATTTGELQTPLHYAARNNAVGSLKILLKLGSSIMARDYKNRTPLYVAAENGRIEAARFLLESGAPAAICDDEGSSCLSLMVDKMPGIALEALEQYYTINRALRKKFYYLSYLEKSLTAAEEDKILLLNMPKKEREKKKKFNKEAAKVNKKEKKPNNGEFAKTALEVIVEMNKLELITHPAIQTLVEVKWNLFGKKACVYNVIKNLFYAIIWSVLGISIPRSGNYYLPLKKHAWRMVFEIIGIMMTLYFMITQYLEAKRAMKTQNAFKHWHYNSVERDLQYCHPKWPEEKTYLDQELQRIESSKSGSYFGNPWNCIDWVIHVIIWVIVFTRVAAIAFNSNQVRDIHLRIFAMSLVLIWLRLLKVCRAFQSLGPFITLLGHVVQDTLKFGFLFFEFFIPYVCAFWMLFGGDANAQVMLEAGASDEGYRKMNDLIYSVYQITLMGEFHWEGLVAVDKLMAQILVGTYIAVSTVICLNLFIALMSDTFARVYQNAMANAMLQQAEQILSAEKLLQSKEKIKVRSYLTEHCAPLERYMSEENKSKSTPGDRIYDKVNRHTDMVIDSVKETIESIKKEVKEIKKEVSTSKRSVPPTIKQWQVAQDKKIANLQNSIMEIAMKQEELIELIKKGIQTDC